MEHDNAMCRPNKQAAILFAVMIAIVFWTSDQSYAQVNAKQQSATSIKDRDESWSARVIESGAAAEIVNRHAKTLDEWEARLREEEKIVSSPDTADETLKALTQNREKLLADIVKLQGDIQPLRDDAKVSLDRLGPPPADGAPAEAADVADQRIKLGGSFAAYDGLLRQLDVLALRTRQLSALANSRRRERFADRLLKPIGNFYSSQFWRSAFASVRTQTELAFRQTDLWLKGFGTDQGWRFAILLALPLLAGIAASIVLLSAFRQTSIGTLHNDMYTSMSARGARAIAGSLVTTMPMMIGVLVFYLLARETQLINPSGNFALINALGLCVGATFYFSLIRRSFAPKTSDFRLFTSISPEANSWIAFLLSSLVAVWLVNELFAIVDTQLRAPQSLIALREIVTVTVFSLLIGALLSVRLTTKSEKSNGWPTWLFTSLAGLVALMVLAVMLGFVSLANFAGSQLVATGGILFTMYLVHNAADYISASGLAGKPVGATGPERPVRQSTSLNAARLTASLLLDILTLAIGVPLLLLQWGFDSVEVHGWITTAFFGFRIGNLTISIQSVIMAIAIIVAGLAATRVLQRWFTHRSSTSPGADSGVRDSIRTIMGYIGVLISGGLAISYLGIDFTNLAIVAGALSVGIGFGLQNVVSNFVSGLILLAERPIKAGDWIVVGNNEGIVHKVNVRATEMRTFDRSSVLIPNSELISKEVTNWTLGNSLARVIINIGVAYDSDPKHVMAVLEQVGRDHPLCLEHPAPQLLFEEFSDSAMNFSLRIFIADVRNSVSVKTDLRTSIWTAFRDAKIEIPFPQRDLNIRHVAKADDETIEDFLFNEENVA